MPLPKTGKRTDQRRQSQNKYDSEHFKVAACKISIDKYNAFQAYAKAAGKPFPACYRNTLIIA